MDPYGETGGGSTPDDRSCQVSVSVVPGSPLGYDSGGLLHFPLLLCFLVERAEVVI